MTQDRTHDMTDEIRRQVARLAVLAAKTELDESDLMAIDALAAAVSHIVTEYFDKTGGRDAEDP